MTRVTNCARCWGSQRIAPATSGPVPLGLVAVRVAAFFAGALFAGAFFDTAVLAEAFFAGAFLAATFFVVIVTTSRYHATESVASVQRGVINAGVISATEMPIGARLVWLDGVVRARRSVHGRRRWRVGRSQFRTPNTRVILGHPRSGW